MEHGRHNASEVALSAPKLRQAPSWIVLPHSRHDLYLSPIRVYYAPAGRFEQSEPFPLRPYSSPYAYGRNNPPSNVDARGAKFEVLYDPPEVVPPGTVFINPRSGEPEQYALGLTKIKAANLPTFSCDPCDKPLCTKLKDPGDISLVITSQVLAQNDEYMRDGKKVNRVFVVYAGYVDWWDAEVTFDWFYTNQVIGHERARIEGWRRMYYGKMEPLYQRAKSSVGRCQPCCENLAAVLNAERRLALLENGVVQMQIDLSVYPEDPKVEDPGYRQKILAARKQLADAIAQQEAQVAAQRGMLSGLEEVLESCERYHATDMLGP